MAIVIDLSVDTGKQDAQFQKIEDSLERIGRQFDVLNGKLLQMAANMRQVANVSQQVRGPRLAPGGRGPGRPLAGPPPLPWQSVVGNPYWQSAVMQGDPHAVQVYNRAIAQQRAQSRAQSAVSPPQSAGFGQNLASLLLRSRYGQGAMPLGMDIARLFGGNVSGAAGAGGGSAGATGAVIAIAAALVAIKAFVAGIKVATEHLRALAQAFVMGGGPISAAQGAMRLGQFAGGDVAEMVRGRSGWARGYGMAAGVSPFAGNEMFDPLGANKAAIKLAEKIGQIADTKGTEAAIAFAHRAGVAPLGKLALLDRGTRERLIGSEKGATGMESLRAGAKMDAELAIFLTELKKLAVNLLTPALEKFNLILGGVNWVVAMVNKGIDTMLGWLKDLWDWLAGHIPGLKGGRSGKSKTDQNTDALNDNTNALRDAMGVFGGGKRAQGAVPAGVRGAYSGYDSEALRRSVRQGAL